MALSSSPYFGALVSFCRWSLPHRSSGSQGLSLDCHSKTVFGLEVKKFSSIKLSLTAKSEIIAISEVDKEEEELHEVEVMECLPFRNPTASMKTTL
jgi:hypothetical protein